MEKIGRVDDPKWAFISRLPLLRRLLRAEISRMYTAPDGTRFAIGKQAIFRCESDGKNFNKCFSVLRGSRPLNLCILPDGMVYFGEYFANMGKEEVNVYRSTDSGINWEVAYTFPRGSINHIHGLFWDNHTKRVWIATGDRENECIIANTADGFKTLDVVFRGGQEYRACNLFFYPDFWIYATDSQYRQNEIIKVDRLTDKREVLAQISGTAIKGGQAGDTAFLSTTVEPSEVNREKSSHVWLTKNGTDWRDVFQAKKDFLPTTLFQFGSIEFPEYQSVVTERLFFSGRSLKGIGGHTVELEIPCSETEP